MLSLEGFVVVAERINSMFEVLDVLYGGLDRETREGWPLLTV
jgi:hypothetical protein